MNGKRVFVYTLSLVLSIFVLSACDSAPPETRAGDWKGTTDFGEFTLVVDPTGMEITEIEYSFESCSSAIISGSVVLAGTLATKDGSPVMIIEDNGSFFIEISGGFSMIFDGKFSRDGTRASGIIEAVACSGDFLINR